MFKSTKQLQIKIKITFHDVLVLRGARDCEGFEKIVE